MWKVILVYKLIEMSQPLRNWLKRFSIPKFGHVAARYSHYKQRNVL
jgi:hypothetical protein